MLHHQGKCAGELQVPSVVKVPGEVLKLQLVQVSTFGSCPDACNCLMALLDVVALEKAVPCGVSGHAKTCVSTTAAQRTLDAVDSSLRTYKRPPDDAWQTGETVRGRHLILA